MSSSPPENATNDSNLELEREYATVQFIVRDKMLEIMKLQQAIKEQEDYVEMLKTFRDTENLHLKNLEKKFLESKTMYEQELREKQEINAKIQELTAKITTIKSQNVKNEERIIQSQACYEFLFKLAPVEWQEAQKAKALKTKVMSEGHTQEEQNEEPEGSDARESLENKESSPDGELPSVSELWLSSSPSRDTLNARSKADFSSSEYKDPTEMYFTEPQQIVDAMMNMREQIFSLFEYNQRKEEEMKKRHSVIKATKNQMEQDEGQDNLLIRDVNKKIKNEKAKAAKLDRMVKIQELLKSVDQDAMLDSVTKKLREVYHCFVVGHLSMPDPDNFKMVAATERYVSFLLKKLEESSAEIVAHHQEMKDRERRFRQREELLREQEAKRQEKMKQHLESSLSHIQKKSGRKLMPRSLPPAPKAKSTPLDNKEDEDEINAYLFGPDDED
ncbi:cilia- and flagella-associated protein 100 [Thalassophryne amazonica]|uniref:cilia- and flagella-associated protein 100 n=1 Tax=Thalassophryne amazonica TaxID=390379 RepID=UPI00147223F3|nr:cilia- and flagella-associated protein 100 [Thalassophryne amazonica]